MKWYSVDNELQQDQSIIKERDRQKRELKIWQSRQELVVRDKKEALMYATDLSKQASQLQELSSINKRHAHTIQEVAQCDLFDQVMEKERKVKDRAAKRERKFHLMAGKELGRLQEVLRADELGRMEARRREKAALGNIVLKPL